MDNPKLSVIVPFYNEEDSIGPMYAAIVRAVEPLNIPFEMVFVDDGSRVRSRPDAGVWQCQHLAYPDEISTGRAQNVPA